MGLKQIKLPKFLGKLYNLLNDNKYSKEIHWSINGDSFIIDNFHNFCYNIMPNVFGLNLFSSFHHQLNCYGFTKINEKEYYNKNFMKDNKNLLFNIKRNKKDKNRINSKDYLTIKNFQNKISKINFRRSQLENEFDFFKTKNEILLNENLFLRNKLIEAQNKQKDLGYIFFYLVESLYPEFSLMKDKCLDFINSSKNKLSSDEESFNIIKNNNISNDVCFPKIKQLKALNSDSQTSENSTHNTKNQEEFSFLDVD